VLSVSSLLLITMTAPESTPAVPGQEPGAELLAEATRTDNFTSGRPFFVRPLPNGRTVLYLQSDPERRVADLWAYDRREGRAEVLLSATALLDGGDERISAEEQARRERLRIKTRGFTSFAISGDGMRLVAKLSGDLYVVDLGGESPRWAKLMLPPGVVLDPRLSPSGRKLGFIKDHDLMVADLPSADRSALELDARAVTTGGTASRSFGQAEFVAQEEMGRMQGYWWGPDDRFIAYQANDSTGVETFSIADAARPQLAARTFPYPRPGRKNVDVRLFVADLQRPDAAHREVLWDRERFPYLARFAWSPSGAASLLVQSRDQQHQRFLRDPGDGRTEVLFEERDDTWLNLVSGVPQWMPDGNSYLYATEEAGAWQLERHWPHASGPGLERRDLVIAPDVGFDRLVGVDAKRGWLWYTGGLNPTETHVFRAPLAGGERPTPVTGDPGEHAATLSSDGGQLAVQHASLDRLPVVTVMGIDDDGRPGPAAELPHRGQQPARLPRVELISPERAGGYHAMVVRPADFEPGRRYPVIVYVYGGPHVNIVKADGHRFFLHQYMADQGFVVVSLDGRGTPRRGREWERAIDGRFGSIPLQDQVKGLEALGAHLPELDLERVGIYGWSFGGTMAAQAVLDRPDVFRAAVSGAPVTDWLYYDTHYTERYLGLPTEDSRPYDEGNLVQRAAQLDRPLMLVHGIADDNVYFAHSLMLAEALFRHGKRYEFVPLVGLTHQLADPDVRLTLYRRIMRFFSTHLR
jgi:dipeptidyl-peptidase-4